MGVLGSCMSEETEIVDANRLSGRTQLSMTVSERWMAALSGGDEESAD